MTNAPAEEEALGHGLEIQSEHHAAMVGTIEDARERVTEIAEEDAAARSGAEHEQAAAWAYDDTPSTGRRRLMTAGCW